MVTKGRTSLSRSTVAKLASPTPIMRRCSSNLSAQVLDFPDGKPSDVGLFLALGRETLITQTWQGRSSRTDFKPVATEFRYDR
jgi:hypothetical protein